MPTASPGSQEKMCRAGFLQLLIANLLDRTHVCKVRAMVFPLKSREYPRRMICASLKSKWLFWMTRVQPHADNLVRLSSVILGIVIVWLIRDDRLLISIRNSFFSGSPFGQNPKLSMLSFLGLVTDREVAPGCGYHSSRTST